MSAAETDLPGALAHALGRLERSLPALREAVAEGKLPHVTDGGRWRLLSPLAPDPTALTGLPWTGGFVAGQLWLASCFPGRAALAADAAAVTDLLAPRAAQATTHDLGFLFWPSAVIGHLVTGEPGYRDLGLRAAGSLARRALPSGAIQVVGALDDPLWLGRVIVDTLPNLMLLWWAERLGLDEAGAIARAHVHASLRAFVRPDGSTFHAARFADDGTVVERGTINGLGPGSTWARGQAWAVHGLVSASRATGDAGIRSAAERTARLFLDRMAGDPVPPWDFRAPAGAPRDASAAAIVASALLDLGDEDCRARALGLLEALATHCLDRGPDDGILGHCCYRFNAGEGLDAATAWGDFFLLDALAHAVAPATRPDPLAGG